MVSFFLFSALKNAQEEATHLETITRGQSSNRIWKEKRAMRLTSSSFGTICKLTEKRDIDK